MSPHFGMFYWFSGMVILILSCFWATHSLNWRKRGDSTRLFFHPPPGLRLFLTGFGLWFVLIPPWLMVRNARDSTGWFLFAVLELMFCSAAALLLWAAGQRCELILDTRHRTYRFTSGWGLWPRTRSGPWDDFAGVFVRCVSINGSEQCTVGLAWKGGGRVAPTLGRYQGSNQARQKADALAVEIADVVRLPRVAPPPPETLRDMFQRSSAS